MHLAAYIRMSTDRQEDSPETQKSIIKEYCKKNGHVVTRTYIDSGISGGSMDKRSALLELLMDAESKLFEGVVVYKYDRAFRNLGEQIATLQKLKRLGVKVMAVADPAADGAGGELIVNILGAVNQFERQLTGERIYHKNRELAKKGKWTGSGIQPFGYHYDKEEKKLNVVPEEAAVVKRIFDLYLEHKSLARVSDILWAEGIKTKLGKTWTATQIRELLINPIHIGKIRFGYLKPNRSGKNRNCESFPAEHDPIIDEETFKKANALLQSNRKGTNRTESGWYLLSGMLRCLKCGGPAVANYVIKLGKEMYRCADAYRISLEYCAGWNKVGTKIYNVTYSLILDNIRGSNIEEYYRNDSIQVDQPQSGVLERRLNAIEQKLLRQVDLYEDGHITKDVYLKKRQQVLKEKEAVLDQMKENMTPVDAGLISVLDNFETIWEEADTEIRRAILKTLIECVHTDGRIVQVSFIDFGIPGWKLQGVKPL
jgi:site-specific DNA recombinase